MRRTNFLLSLYLLLITIGCTSNKETIPTKDFASLNTEITSVLDSFHTRASRADYMGYFDLLSEDATFIGTDASEHWTKDSFKTWAKPYFDRGKAWSFTCVDRHIYIDSSAQWAWFDELLSTQMKICRGSGIVIFKNNTWKIRQYVLSMTIPNSLTSEVSKLKTPEEDSILNELKLK